MARAGIASAIAVLGIGTTVPQASAQDEGAGEVVVTAMRREADDLTLSVVAPDQYRGAVAEAIARDGREMVARVGPDYGVEIEWPSRPVEYARAGLSDVLLYVPYKLIVVPRR